MKKRFLAISVMLIFLFFGNICFPRSQANLTNLWGVSNGDSRIYCLGREVRGSVTGLMEEYFLQYNIIAVTDIDADNYTDVIVSVTHLSTRPITVNQIILPDMVFGNYKDNLAFSGQGYPTLFTFIRLYISSLVVPISCDKPGGLTYGLNWTDGLNFINTSFIYPNHTAYDHGDRAVITYNKTNNYDGSIQAYYNETGVIIWDRTTGWLESVEYIRIYEEPLGFSIWITVKPDSGPPSTASSESLLIEDFFAWVGLGMGIAGLAFALYALKKTKKSPPTEVD